MQLISIGSNRIDEQIIEFSKKLLFEGQFCRYYDKFGKKKEGFISSVESEAEKLFKSNFALATTSATQALTICLKSINVKSREVIVPAYAFSACPHAVLAAEGIPIIAPISDCLSIDVEKVEELITENTKAIMVVHMRGFTTNMNKLRQIADKNNLFIIEDCSQFDGSFVNNNLGWSGISDMAVLSFQAKKIISCGEGGMILTNNSPLFEIAFKLHDPAWNIRGIEFENNRDSNYFHAGSRMNEITAMILLPQMITFNNFIESEHKKIEYIVKMFKVLNKSTEKVDIVNNGGLNIAFLFKEKVNFTKVIEYAHLIGLPYYPESLNLNDIHYYEGWPKYIKGRVKVPISLSESSNIIDKVIVFQMNPFIPFDEEIKKWSSLIDMIQEVCM